MAVATAVGRVKRYLRSFGNREALGQLVRVGVIGVVNTVVSFALFNLFVVMLGAAGQEGNDLELFVATAASFIITTFLAYVLNRRWSFALTEGGLSGRETARFYLINMAALGVTTLVVSGANALWGPLSQLGANVAYGAAALLIILPKFAGYRDVVFKDALERRGRDGVTLGPEGRHP